jgi:amino acid transporter
MTIKTTIGKGLIKFADLLENIRRNLRKILVFVLGVILGFTLCGILVFSGADKKQKVKKFIREIVASAANQTEFYKANSTRLGLEGVQKHAKEFSSAYTVFNMDYTLGTYESVVIFDNGRLFYVEVYFDGDAPMLSLFEPSKWPEHTVTNTEQ